MNNMNTELVNSYWHDIYEKYECFTIYHFTIYKNIMIFSIKYIIYIYKI